MSRFKYEQDIKSIKKMHVPKYILNANKKKHIQGLSKFRKDRNKQLYNQEVYEQPEPERHRKIQKTE